MDITFNTMYRPWLGCDTGEDGRHELMHILLDARGWLVANNGFLMVVVPCEIADAPKGFKRALLPAAIVKAAAEKRKGADATMVIKGKQVMVENHMGYDGATLTAPVSPLDYPAWRPIIPDLSDPVPQSFFNFHPPFLSVVTRAIGLSGKTNILKLSSAGLGKPAIILGAEDIETKRSAFGVVMPVFCNELASEKALAAIGELRNEVV